MDHVFTHCLYGLTGVLLTLSFVKSRRKTALSLKKAWRMFWGVLPQFLAILFLIGLLLAVLQPDTIQAVIGSGSGITGILLSALLGSVAVIPALIAFPIASELLRNGAGLIQIAVFISTLTTVGFATMPIECRYLGKKATVLRNVLALLFSFASAFLVWVVLD
jgi:uncharacterized membrane protein YraQ (UPF0718 family)